MADKPITFSGPMVRALLDGTKTQTRRLQIFDVAVHAVRPSLRGGGYFDVLWWNESGEQADWFKPRICAGDYLYVREEIRMWGNGYVRFEADGRETFLIWPESWKQRHANAMHMPRKFSRLTLFVRGVKIERLQDISEEDAIAEGVIRVPYTGDDPSYAGMFGWKAYDRLADGSEHPHNLAPYAKATRSYQSLWDSINMKSGNVKNLWKSNPWVACYEFDVYKSNIDHMDRVKMKGAENDRRDYKGGELPHHA